MRDRQSAHAHRELCVPRGLTVLLGLLALGGCKPGQGATSGSSAAAATDTAPPSARPEESRMWMTVGDRRFAITLADNAAARALAARLPLTLDMRELNGNEKHADLAEALPANASRPGTIRTGDLMLYGTNTLVVFYAAFETSYAYTRLGRVNDPRDLPPALGRGSVRVAFSRESLPDGAGVHRGRSYAALSDASARHVTGTSRRGRAPETM